MPPLEQEETGLTQHPALGKEASARAVGLPPAAQIGQGLILPARASGSQRDHPPRGGCRTHPRPALLGGGLWEVTPGLFYRLCLCPGGRPRREGKGCEGMGVRCRERGREGRGRGRGGKGRGRGGGGAGRGGKGEGRGGKGREEERGREGVGWGGQGRAGRPYHAHEVSAAVLASQALLAVVLLDHSAQAAAEHDVGAVGLVSLPAGQRLWGRAGHLAGSPWPEALGHQEQRNRKRNPFFSHLFVLENRYFPFKNMYTNMSRVYCDF